ncbi:polysaccharide deacetylase family protein [Chitinophaga vietnamensis]|uniref:polysaccharide deacetylase family protein n=1 Tax=Chitinophaga vietnamensis TaxID=2593957 RepID=UPI00117857A6|nr:polysaccharide deacetylase family protein [Chitinophaga vietnamensis]
MTKDRYVLLSFDVEEFDMPLEYNQQVNMADQMRVGHEGLIATMDIVNATNARSTFFTTANFARTFPGDIKEIATKHEIASHTFYHSSFTPEHLLESKQLLESITEKPVYGLRMPRMRHVEMLDVKNAGYVYDSSINPTWIPGRYNYRSKPRTVYTEEGVLRVPAAVSPNLRIPLFWLAFKNFPYAVFKSLALQTLKHDGYLCLYFHPWEFVELTAYQIPAYTKRHAGPALQNRLRQLLRDLSAEGSFITMQEYLELKNLC